MILEKMDENFFKTQTEGIVILNVFDILASAVVHSLLQ